MTSIWTYRAAITANKVTKSKVNACQHIYLILTLFQVGGGIYAPLPITFQQYSIEVLNLRGFKYAQNLEWLRGYAFI